MALPKRPTTNAASTTFWAGNCRASEARVEAAANNTSNPSGQDAVPNIRTERLVLAHTNEVTTRNESSNAACSLRCHPKRGFRGLIEMCFSSTRCMLYNCGDGEVWIHAFSLVRWPRKCFFG